jgi:ATP-dependent helicase YprA (DUF1998 family)
MLNENEVAHGHCKECTKKPKGCDECPYMDKIRNSLEGLSTEEQVNLLKALTEVAK